MDRDTVRIALLVIGILVIAGIYVWGRYKQKILDFMQRRAEDDDELYEDEDAPASQAQQDDDEDEYESLGFKGRKEAPKPARTAWSEPEPEQPMFAENLFDDDQFALGDEPAPKPRSAEKPPEPVKEKPKAAEPTKLALGAPFLIQVSVVAGRGRVFGGEELRDALLDLDLIHGSMGIFHRYDRGYREALFSIASLVEPGTFPMDDIDGFECPGVVLFFQPDRVANPLAVYDDLIRTSHALARRLDGIEWDDKRQPLSREKIAHMRGLLEDACEEP